MDYIKAAYEEKIGELASEVWKQKQIVMKLKLELDRSKRETAEANEELEEMLSHNDSQFSIL